MTAAHQQLQAIAQQVQALRDGRGSIDALISQSTSAHELRSTLPAAFGTVIDNLTDRLQASALFTEESCSFSRTDLIDSLQLWVDKAQQRLQPDPP